MAAPVSWLQRESVQSDSAREPNVYSSHAAEEGQQHGPRLLIDWSLQQKYPHGCALLRWS